MPRNDLLRYITPWRFRREREAARRLAALRARDGDNCARCRRPIRFDLPSGHDLGAKVEAVRPGAHPAARAIDGLCLTHGRCNAGARDDTDRVRERLRPKREAALIGKARARRKSGKAR